MSRITLPSLLGESPRSDLAMPFSISFICEASHGWIMMVRESGTDTVASWLIGVRLP